jgi:hypothetical protein
VTRCALVAVSPAKSISRATGAAGGTTNTAIWPKNGPVSPVLLSSSSCFEGGADLAGDSKELVFNRQLFEHPSFVEVK